MKYFFACLILINALGFWLMHSDKERARKKRWRIPEATLMAVAMLGGSVGVLLGIYTFRHKTKHPQFTLGVPAILVLQMAVAVLWR